MSQENLVEFEDYVAAIGRRRKLVAAIVGAFLFVSVIGTFLMTKQYTAQARVLVNPVVDPTGNGSPEEVNIDTERGVAKSGAVAELAANALGGQQSASDLVDHLSVSVISDSVILRFEYTDTSATAAFEGAKAFSEEYLTFRRRQANTAAGETLARLETQASQLQGELNDLTTQLSQLSPGTPDYESIQSQISVIRGELNSVNTRISELDSAAVDPGTIIDAAEEPSGPSSPNLMLNVAGGTLLGLVVALFAAFVLERKNLGSRPTESPTPDPVPTPSPTLDPAPLTAAPAASAAEQASDRRQRRDVDAELAQLGVPVFGTVPRLTNDAEAAPFDTVTALDGGVAESLAVLHRDLRTQMQARGAHTVLIAAPARRGVTIGIAGGLAITAAQTGDGALLIGGDLQDPHLHERFQLGNDQGLAEVLRGERPIQQVMQGWSGIESLAVVTAGRAAPGAAGQIAGQAFATHLAQLRSQFQLIVIEAPPVLSSSDTVEMARAADVCLLAVDPRGSDPKDLADGVHALSTAGTEILGSIMIEARRPSQKLVPS